MRKPLEIIGALAGNNGLALTLAPPATANATATWSKVWYNRAMGNPRSAATLQSATNHWSKVVAPHVGISADDLQEHLASAVGQEGQGQ
jgi:hypothetical protein